MHFLWFFLYFLLLLYVQINFVFSLRKAINCEKKKNQKYGDGVRLNLCSHQHNNSAAREMPSCSAVTFATDQFADNNDILLAHFKNTSPTTSHNRLQLTHCRLWTRATVADLRHAVKCNAVWRTGEIYSRKKTVETFKHVNAPKPGYQHVDKASNTTATKEHVQHYVMITVSQ